MTPKKIYKQRKAQLELIEAKGELCPLVTRFFSKLAKLAYHLDSSIAIIKGEENGLAFLHYNAAIGTYRRLRESAQEQKITPGCRCCFNLPAEDIADKFNFIESQLQTGVRRR